MKYKITVEEILGKNKLAEEKLEFEAESHENIINIAKKLTQHPDFNDNEAASLGIGLKLFTGVMLKNKKNPLFKNFMPHFKDFMMGFKSYGK